MIFGIEKYYLIKKIAEIEFFKIFDLVFRKKIFFERKIFQTFFGKKENENFEKFNFCKFFLISVFFNTKYQFEMISAFI